MNIEIKSFEELIQFIENNELTIEKMNEIISKALKVYYSTNADKETIITNIKEYWNQYKDIEETPLFPDIKHSIKDNQTVNNS